MDDRTLLIMLQVAYKEAAQDARVRTIVGGSASPALAEELAERATVHFNAIVKAGEQLSIIEEVEPEPVTKRYRTASEFTRLARTQGDW